MPTFTLTDVSHEVWVEDMTVDAAQLGLAVTAPWSVSKRRLRGGRRDGVDLIVVDNGALRFAVVPTRGMGLWKGFYLGNFLGWESPITDGPVHPSFVNLMADGGLGWLDGYDELMSRCGLENNGAPFEVKTVHPDGSESHTTFGLHGRIANIPASYVAVHVDAEPPHEIIVEGHVEESRLFGPQIRLETRYATVPGSNVLSIHDEFVNLKDQPVEMQILYHCNFGPPFLEEGSRFVAPMRTVTPRDARAEEGIDHHDRLRRPRAGLRRAGRISTTCTPSRPTAGRRWPCSATRPATRRSCSGSARTSSRHSPCGRTRPGCATAMSPGWSRPRITPTRSRSKRPAAAS